MGTETEVKIEVDKREMERVRKNLPTLGGLCTLEGVEEKNELFDFPDGRLSKKESVLRLRQRGTLTRVTLKIKEAQDGEFRIRKELQCDVNSAAELRSIFLHLGLRAWFRYDKFREIWELGTGSSRVKVSLDETPVGRFIELEGEPESILSTAAKLMLDRKRFTTTTYIELYQQRKTTGQAGSKNR